MRRHSAAGSVTLSTLFRGILIAPISYSRGPTRYYCSGYGVATCANGAHYCRKTQGGTDTGPDRNAERNEREGQDFTPPLPSVGPPPVAFLHYSTEL